MRLLIASVFAIAVMAGCSKKEKAPFIEPVTPLYEASLKPFYHGVASGDPLTDRVVIWTRVTPPDSAVSVLVKWELSIEPTFQKLVQTDIVATTPKSDYTVKVDVEQLQPGTVYYYRFSAFDIYSPIGRTRTLPTTSPDSLKLAVVSCSNWEFGYFNAYDRIAEKDVDAVLHLGDYIYEYEPGRYGDTTIGRKHLPAKEIISLSDYRTRYSQYRLDQGLRNMTARHPLIAVWDDHEIANNSYVTGAQNHQEGEGDYALRKAAARQAYYEWLPIREGGKLYRSFAYGQLANLLMLDERLEGRTKQPESEQDSAYLSDQQTMLGAEQLQWLEQQLKMPAAWKIIGNQVIFSDVMLGAVYPSMPKNLDAWDGYPKEKQKIRNSIVDNQISDVVFLAGDTHSAWAIEAAADVAKTYDPKTSRGAFALEFGTTSVSSGNSDERTDPDTVRMMEAALLKTNPHIKYLNARDHGYLLITFTPAQVRADYFMVNTLRTIDAGERLDRSYTAQRGSTQLR
jgi:alkaline phosphatase D